MKCTKRESGRMSTIKHEVTTTEDRTTEKSHRQDQEGISWQNMQQGHEISNIMI